MILAGLILIGTGEDARLHKFVFVSDKPANSVNLAGSFNNWNKDETAMKLDSDGRTWSVSLKLPYGKHYYKFVRNKEEWIPDPRAEKNEDDGSGNINSLLTLLPPDYEIKASPTDGVTALSALHHEQAAPYLNYDQGKLQLSIRVRPNDIREVRVLSGGKSFTAKSLATSDSLYGTYKVEVPWNRKSNLNYRFELFDGAKKVLLGSKGVNSSDAFTINYRTFKPYEVPNWVESGVIYQIFPDRFANGDAKNDPTGVQKWTDTPTYSNRFGGDTAGVKSHLSYLKNLGVTTVYFNPVFVAPSNHRYDAIDFYKVDPEFGTNQEFLNLIKSMKGSGIRTVMDFVFNHTATTFPPFADLVKNGESSKYRNWYFPKSFPIKVQENPNYEAWWGYASMPKLNVNNPEVKKYLLDVAQYWAKEAGIDGMRLDVANEVDMNYWRALRPHVKSINPNLWIVGEIWTDGSAWLKGDQFDSVMNYQFRDACLKFIASDATSASQFANRLMAVHQSYAPQVSRNMMNLLSSHDTPRFLTECKSDKDLAILAATIQFTWVGAPSVYYGEELGMEGGKDPDNRRGMMWDTATPSNPFLSHYKKLASIRTKVRAFGDGEPRFEMTDDSKQVGVFSRVGQSDAALVAFNRSNQEQTISLRVPASVHKYSKLGFIDAISGTRYGSSDRPILLKLKPKSAQVLIPASKSNLSPAPNRASGVDRRGFGSTPSESISGDIRN